MSILGSLLGGGSNRPEPSQTMQSNAGGLMSKFNPFNLVSGMFGGRKAGAADNYAKTSGGMKKGLKDSKKKDPKFVAKTSRGDMPIQKGDSVSDIAARLYNLIKSNEEKKKKELQIEQNFAKSLANVKEKRNQELIKALTERPKGLKKETKQIKKESDKVEKQTKEAKKEAPKVKEPTKEAPKAKEPVKEAPKEAPKAKEPVKEAPKEVPKGKEPVKEAPKPKEPAKAKRVKKEKPSAAPAPAAPPPAAPSAAPAGVSTVAKTAIAIPAALAGTNAIAGVIEVGKGYNIVQKPDGSLERREGDRNWRNNNPGNIEYGTYAKENGAIGSDGRFAIFPTYEVGRKAKSKLIFEGKNYRNLYLPQAIERYAPPKENPTEVYKKNALAAVSGQNKLMHQYDESEREKILNAIEKQEGFRKGKAIALSNDKAVPERASSERKTGTEISSLSRENAQIKKEMTEKKQQLVDVNINNNVVAANQQRQTMVQSKSDASRFTEGART